jgi:hypothetical protein
MSSEGENDEEKKHREENNPPFVVVCTVCLCRTNNEEIRPSCTYCANSCTNNCSDYNCYPHEAYFDACALLIMKKVGPLVPLVPTLVPIVIVSPRKHQIWTVTRL